MTLAPDFLIVPEHVARNPICRAVQRANMRRAVRDFAIRLHILRDGECAASDGQAAAKVLAVAIRLHDKRGTADSPACRVMRGGLECIVQLSERRWKWRAADAQAIDAALQRAQDTVAGATALEVQDAYRYVDALERQVMEQRHDT